MLKKIPFILSFLYLFVATTSISILGIDSQKDVNSVSSIGYLMLLVNAFLICNLITKWSKLKQIIIRNKILFILLFLFIVSCLWSDNRWVALKNFVKFLGIVVSFMIIMLNDRQNFWRVLLIYIIVTCFVSLFLIVLLPEYGIMVYEGSLLPKGIFSHKNGLGIFGALSCLICLYNYKFEKKKRHVFLFFICFVLLLLSKSATSLIGFFLSLIFYFFIKTVKNKLWLLMIIISLFISLGIINSCFEITNLFDFIFSHLGKDSSFTGRDALWAILIKIGMQQPVFGFGYGSFFRGDETQWVSNLIGWAAPTAHNGFLQIFLEMGFVGLAITLVFIIDMIKQTISSKNVLLLIFIPLVLIFNFSEAGLFNQNFMSVFIVGFYMFLKGTNINA